MASLHLESIAKDFLRSKGNWNIGLFGVKILGSKINSEIAFFERKIETDLIELTDEHYNLQGIKLKIPPHYCNLSKPIIVFNFQSEIAMIGETKQKRD